MNIKQLIKHLLILALFSTPLILFNNVIIINVYAQTTPVAGIPWNVNVTPTGNFAVLGSEITFVGIGTDSPTQALELGQALNILLNSSPGTPAAIGFGGVSLSGAANVTLYSDNHYMVFNSQAGHPIYFNFDNTNAASTVDFFAGKVIFTEPGSVGIGISPTSTFHVIGSQAGNVHAYTDTDNITATDFFVQCNKGTAMTMTLPTPIGVNGRYYIIKNIGVGTCTLATAAGLIDGLATQPIITNASISVFSDNANWNIF